MDLEDYRFHQIKEVISHNNSFIITSHINPDGDAVGSTIALYHFLIYLKKDVHVIFYSKVPKYYQFLDPDHIIQKYEENQKEIIHRADVIFILDMNDISRVRLMSEPILNSDAKIVLIDHHQPNSKFAHLEYTDSEASSTGELLFKLLTSISSLPLSKDISNAIYTAIMTDTQSFHLPRTTSELFKIVSQLLEWGADPCETYFNVYEKNNINRFILLGKVLADLQIICDGKIAYSIITQSLLNETKTEETDLENFIDYGMKIENILIVIFFVELKDGMKISFRSRGKININEIAKKYGGGGHFNAAGLRLFNVDFEEIKNKILNDAKEVLSNLKLN